MVKTKLIAFCLAAAMAIAPVLSYARAGGSYSGGSRSAGASRSGAGSHTQMHYENMGSRGSRTYEPVTGAKPIERTVAKKPAQSPQSPSATQAPYQSSITPIQSVPAPTPAPTPMLKSSSFWGPFAGAMAGTWIGGMLFNHTNNSAPAYTSPVGGGGDYRNGTTNHTGDISFGAEMLLFGALFLALGIGVAAWNARRREAEAIVSFPAANLRRYSTQEQPSRQPVLDFSHSGPADAYNTAPAGRDMATTPADLAEFSAILKAVQEAWGKQDISRLRRNVTPEMLSYFSEKLSDMASQGVANIVEDIDVRKVEVSEAWTEETMEYATARMEWDSRDYVVHPDVLHTDPAYLVAGDPTELVPSVEYWTYTRSSNGGHWLLSAIQQAN